LLLLIISSDFSCFFELLEINVNAQQFYNTTISIYYII